MTKTDTENEQFLDVFLDLGFTVTTATAVLYQLRNNQALIRLIGQGTNFVLSDRQMYLLQNALMDAGIPSDLAKKVTDSVQKIHLKNKTNQTTLPTSALTNALVKGGIEIGLAKTIVELLYEDEKIDEKPSVMFMTQRDNKVDDKICLPLEGMVYEIDDKSRPKIPSDTHPNCRCYYLETKTGEHLGQF